MATKYGPQPHHEIHTPATHLSSHANSRLWTEPDFLPNDGDAGLPMLSTIGRGPRGEGIMIEADETEDSYTLTFKSDITGEVLCSSGNLSSGIVSAHQIETRCQAGAQSTFYIDITRGGETTSYPVVINPGAAGSRIFMTKNSLAQNANQDVGVYYVTYEDLTYYGALQWEHVPHPRVGDVAMALIDMADGYSTSLGIGTITSFKEGQAVVVMRILMPTKSPYIKDGNWWIGNTDTGISASGMSSEEIKEVVNDEVDEALKDKNLLTSDEVETLVDEKISKINYYIDDNGKLVREILE